ncbi:hypothetical protein EC50588_0688 [Escherichia coli 5.0588]|nr:hypothetical protein EC50588_0688 [Escherichia coli 5.0588]
MDRFGRTQTFHREAAGEFSGEITGVTDGAGRHFRLVLTTQVQRAEEARQQAISGGTDRPLFLIPCRVTPNMAGTTASVCLPCG